MITQPESFISTTDFPTLKNDNRGSASVVVPASVSIPGNGSLEFHADITIGVAGAVTQCRIRSSGFSSQWIIGQMLSIIRTGSNSGSPTPYNIYAFIYRTSPTNLRCEVYIPNPYSTVTTGGAGETIDYFVNTFIPPFA